MRTLQDYVAAYGQDAGAKLYRTIRSRAAYKGVSTRRRHQIEALTGRPYRVRRRKVSGPILLPLRDPDPDQGTESTERPPLTMETVSCLEPSTSTS
jgi:hypothetical protein